MKPIADPIIEIDPEVDEEELNEKVRYGPTELLFMSMSETLNLLADTVIGHRQTLLEAGFDEDACELMAMSVHESLVNRFIG